MIERSQKKFSIGNIVIMKSGYSNDEYHSNYAGCGYKDPSRLIENNRSYIIEKIVTGGFNSIPHWIYFFEGVDNGVFEFAIILDWAILDRKIEKILNYED